jgi:hypothetical protein
MGVVGVTARIIDHNRSSRQHPILLCQPDADQTEAERTRRFGGWAILGIA